MVFDFPNRVVIVTGAVGNLGRAVANAFLGAGARLVLVDRAPDRLVRLYPGLVDAPGHFLAAGVDLTAVQAMEEMVAETLRRFGRVDVLVNAAGGYRGGKAVHETPLEIWDDMLDRNLRTALVASRAVIPAMLEQRYGKIVTVGAQGGLSGGARSAAYSAAKSAVVRLTESMAAELKRTGINVNCILPSTIDTPQNREAMPKADPSRWVEPEDIADVVLFLASDAARAIHGAAVPVYGTG